MTSSLLLLINKIKTDEIFVDILWKIYSLTNSSWLNFLSPLISSLVIIVVARLLGFFSPWRSFTPAQGCQIQILENRSFSWKIRIWSRDFSQKIRRKTRRVFLEIKRKTGDCHVVFFKKAKIFTLTNVCNFGFHQTNNEKVCLTKRNKAKQRKLITCSLLYWSFRSCSFKNINKTGINRF
jgi:hypothetical protein